MTDLELIKRIAEIEGVCHSCEFGYILAKDEHGDVVRYNPLTDKALLWDAMVKYEVDIIWTERIVQSGYHDTLSVIEFEDNNELPRAIIKCIVEAHK